jgi:hypothetical protein
VRRQAGQARDLAGVEVDDRLEVLQVGRVELERLRVGVRHRPDGTEVGLPDGERLAVWSTKSPFDAPSTPRCGTASVSWPVAVRQRAGAGVGQAMTSAISDVPPRRRVRGG